MNQDGLLHLFHHIHHINGEHKVHHCGGAHKEIDPTVDYTIGHCNCGKHKIDKPMAIGHASDANLDLLDVQVTFTETCPEGGWHVESGVLQKKLSDTGHI